MSDIKSISDVKDLYDLIELYANLDENADGLLGAGEVPAEEIAKYDQGGVDAATVHAQDGYISPREVAKARGVDLKGATIVRVGSRSYFFSTYLRDSSDRVTQGTLIGDLPSPYGSPIIHRAGTPLSFFDDGTVMEGSPECFSAHFPKIKLSGSIPPERFLDLMRTLSMLAPKLLGSIRGIDVNSLQDMPADAGGYADKDTMTLSLRSDLPQLEARRLLPHEAAHLFTLQLGKEGSDFEKRWEEATQRVDGDNPIYGRDIDQIVLDNFDFGIGTRWHKHNRLGHNEGPRRGCISSYGCQNFMEDVATSLEVALHEPMHFRELIDARSGLYEQHRKERPYARVYREKLELLREYGFITERQYRKIVPQLPAGVSKFCMHEAINCPHISQPPHDSRYPPLLSPRLPLTPEYDELRRDAWRISMDRWSLDRMWSSLSWEERHDPSLTAVLEERGESLPRPMSWEIRLGVGRAFGSCTESPYTHLGLDLRWKPIHLHDDRMHLGLMVGGDRDFRFERTQDDHDVEHAFISGKLGGVFEWSSSVFGLSASPFLSIVRASRTRSSADEEEATEVTEFAVQRMGVGMELSAKLFYPGYTGQESQYSERFGYGLSASYAYRRLLSREDDSFEAPAHQLTGGLLLLF